MLNLPKQNQQQYLSEENLATFFQSINPAINPNLNSGFPQPVLSSGILSKSNGDDQSGVGIEGENAVLKSQIVAELGDCSSSSSSNGATVINPVVDNSAISSSLCNLPVIEVPNMVPEKTKVSQLVRCEVCDIDFNSSAVYTSHMSGKRHKKKTEMLNIINTSGGGAIADAVNVAFADGVETKLQKSVEGSWTTVFMRFCTLCSVVCNTQDMYDQHLVGKIHTAQAHKMAQNVKELSVAANPNSVYGGGAAGIPQNSHTSNRNKKTMDQLAWCEVCNISCTSKDVLGIHKQGKKHQKNMTKPSTIISDPITGQMEELYPAKADQSNKATHKIVSCDICGIYCTSEDLLAIHKLGKKHLKKLEKLKTETNPGISTLIDAPASTDQGPIKEMTEDSGTEKSKIMEGIVDGSKPYCTTFLY